MNELHNGIGTWWDGILYRGGSAREAVHDFGVALWLFLAALCELTVKLISLVLWSAAALREVFQEKWFDVHASIQRVTADLIKLCLSWREDIAPGEDIAGSFDVVIDAMAVFLKNSFSSLAALSHYFVEYVEKLFGSKLPTDEMPADSTGTRDIPVLASFSNYMDQRLKLQERRDSLMASVVPRVQQGRHIVGRLVSDAQLLLEKVAEVNHTFLFSVYCTVVFIVWFILLMNESEGMVSGFLFGLLNGLGIMRFWAWMMALRGKQRANTTSNANVLDGTTHGQLKKVFAGDGKPPGAPLEGFEKVEWLNKLLKKVWPSVAAAIEDHRPEVRDFLEAFMENYRLGVFQVIGENEVEQKVHRYIPSGETLTALYLNDLNLGTAAPQIGGVKFRDMKDNKIVMDVRFRWKTEGLTITLGVGTSDGNLKVLLENLQIVATIRVHFYFVEEPPFLSILVLFTPTKLKPTIQYRLTPDQDALEHLQPIVIPKLNSLIYDSIHDSLHWPNRLVVLPMWAAKPTVNADDLQLKPHGQLHITIVKGEDLVNLYAYVLLYIRVKFKVRTKSVENTPNPVWNEEFYLDAEDQQSQVLVMQVMNESKGKDELIGVVTYPLAKLDPDTDLELELPVQTVDRDSEGKDGGLLMIVLRYHVYTKEEQDAAVVAEKKLDEALAAPEAPGSYTTALELLHG